MSTVEELGLKIDSSGVTAATKNLKEFQTQSDATGKSADAMAKEVNASTASVGDMGKNLDSLQMPLKNVKTGVEEATKVIGLNRIQMMESMHVSREMGSMLLMGVNPLQAAAMESGRIVTLLTIGEGSIKDTLAALGRNFLSAAGSVMSFVNPLVLVTAGVAAAAVGVAYLFGVFKSNVASQETITNDMKGLAKATQDYSTAAAAAAQPISTLYDKLGKGAKDVKALYDITAAYDKLIAQQSMNKAMTDIESQFSGLDRVVNIIKQQQASPFGTMVGKGATSLSAAVDETVSKLGLAREKIVDLNSAVNDLDKAKTFPDQIQAITRIIDLLSQAKDKQGNIPPEAKKLVDELKAAGIQLVSIQESSNKATDGINGMASAADALKKNMAAAAAYSQALQNSANAIKTAGESAQHQLTIAQINAGAKTPDQKAAAAGKIAGLQFQWSQPSIAGLDWRDQQAAIKAREEMQKKIEADAVATYKLNEATKTTTASMKKMTDVQKEEQRIMDQLNMGSKSFDVTQKALDDLMSHHVITLQQYNQQLAILKERQLESTSQGKFMADTFGNFETSLTQQIVQVHTLNDAFNVLRSTLAQLAQQLASQLLQSALFGTGAFSGGGTIASPGASLFGGIISNLAHMAGGGVSDGGLTVVGEKGPELVNLPRGAQVHPADMTKRMITGMGQMAPVVNNKIINVLDPSLLGEHLASHEGEQQVLNIVGKNKDALQ